MAEEGVERIPLSKRIREGWEKRMKEARAKAGEIVARSPTGLDSVTEKQIEKETGMSTEEITGGAEPE